MNEILLQNHDASILFVFVIAGAVVLTLLFAKVITLFAEAGVSAIRSFMTKSRKYGIHPIAEIIVNFVAVLFISSYMYLGIKFEDTLLQNVFKDSLGIAILIAIIILMVRVIRTYADKKHLYEVKKENI